MTQKLSSQLSGSGKIQLKGKALGVAAKLSGSGSIRYFGEPAGKIHTKVAGSGSIRLATE